MKRLYPIPEKIVHSDVYRVVTKEHSRLYLKLPKLILRMVLGWFQTKNSPCKFYANQEVEMVSTFSMLYCGKKKKPLLFSANLLE